MTIDTWDTRQPPRPEFERAWDALLGRSGSGNFSLDLRFLAWEARHGRHAIAVRAEDGSRFGAIVLRVEGGELVSGWPWRWQAVSGTSASGSGADIGDADGRWLFERACEAAGSRRLRVLLPAHPPAHEGAFPAGATLIRALDRDDDGLLRDMDGNKRRAVKQALREGWTVREAAGPADYRAFCQVQHELELKRGQPSAEVPAVVDEPGESWREWELPWQWLLIAERDGVVGAGSGYGVMPGGTIEYRANASTDEARKAGANVLLAWEALRRGRDRGCRWMNWCGVTDFKRTLGGERIDIHCWLGGGPLWALPNAAETAWRVARNRLPAVARSLRRGAGRAK